MKTKLMVGFVPAGTFANPVMRQGFATSYGSLDSTSVLFDQAVKYLGQNRYRVWILLGGSPTASWRTGRSRRLSQLHMTRLCWLVLVKAATGLNTSGLVGVDWLTGELVMAAGQPERLNGRKAVTA